jgi:TPR repeat protein
MGEVTTVTHEGTEITLSMIKWGTLRRMAASGMMKLGPEAPAKFVPQYEIAIYKGSPKAVFSSKPIFVFYYPDGEVAFAKWSELVAKLKSGGLYGQQMQAFIRDGNPETQGFLAVGMPEIEKLRKELQSKIAAESLKFSGDVKSQYEGKIGSDQLNQMILNIGALSFFVHALDRFSFRPHSETLRTTIHLDTALALSRLYGKMIGAINPKLAGTAEQDTLNNMDLRGSQYAEAPSLVGESGNDRNGAVWLAACAISEDVDHPKNLLLIVLIKNRLMQGLINLNLGQRIEAIEELVGMAGVPAAQAPEASPAAKAPQSFEDAIVAYNRGDYATAMRSWRFLADQGHASAQSNLGFMYDKGRGVLQDYAEAVRWFRLAADQGDAEAQCNLGNMYAKGQGVPQDYAEAARWFRLAASQGYAQAQYSLGNIYTNGRGVLQDYAEAVRWFRLAADQGNASAQSNLGFMYNNGRGVPQDDMAALSWYRKAADQGNVRAQFNLGSMYSNGRGVPQDYAEAVKWYRKAADQGDADAQFNLGLMYDKGHGVPQDDAAAASLYRKAADQGDASAQFNLGSMYSNGRGVPRDYAEAVKWYRKAADQGDADAQNNLGLMYSNGRGVPQNYVNAHMWFNLASAQGDQSAVKNRDLVEKDMTPAQIAEAQKLAREWKPTKQPPR